MNGNYQIGDVVFGNWVIQREIGKGSFGKVYVVGHEDDESITAALKVITVPQDAAEVKMAADEGMDYQELNQHFYGMVQQIEKEFKLQFKVKGSGHVVAYEDHKVDTHKDQFGRDILGWDILIRMELLTPLLTWAYEHPMTRADIMRLGIHLCRALEACQVHGILHRDIKPENIFVSATGDFKLGDFGVARTMEKTMSGMSKKGTYNYMAPEVYKGLDCNFKADIYSVGIVLYRLLNRNRLPFLPPASQQVTMRDRDQALARRMKGERLPLPLYAQDRLGEIVIKAANYDPAQRYASPSEMRRELEDALRFERDDRAIYPDAEDLRKRREVDRMSRTNDPSVTPRMTDRTMFGEKAESTVWENDSADKTASGWGGRPVQEEKEDLTSSTVSAWSHNTPSKKKVTSQDKREDASDEAYIAMKKASEGAMGEAVEAAKRATKDTLKAVKIAKKEKEENRQPRNEKEAQAAYDRARKARDAKTAERLALENMGITDPQLKAQMMKEAAKAEMEATAKEAEARKTLESFQKKRKEEEAAKLRQLEAEARLASMNKTSEETRQKKAVQAAQSKPAKPKKKSKDSVMKVAGILVGIGVIGLIVCVIINVVNGNIGGNSSNKSQMAQKVSNVAEEYWDMFYDSLDVDGDLNYRTSSLEEIAQVLYDAGFQFQDDAYNRVDEIFIKRADYGSGTVSAYAPEMEVDKQIVYPHVNITEMSNGERWITFDNNMSYFYEAQTSGEIQVFLPGQYALGATRAEEFGIDAEMIQWAQGYMDDHGNEYTDTDAWSIRATGSEFSDGTGSFSIMMKIEEEDKMMRLSFEKGEGDTAEYVLSEVYMEIPQDPAVVWVPLLEKLTQNLFQSLDLSELSGINYQTDSLEEIAQKLEENSVTFYVPEENESKWIYEEEYLEDPHKMFSARFTTGLQLGMMDSEHHGIVERSFDPLSAYYEPYTAQPSIQPSYLIPGEMTMESLGITEQMLQQVEKDDDDPNGGEYGYSFDYGNWQVYQCMYKDRDPDQWHVNFVRFTPEAQDGVGDNYVTIALTFDSVDGQWILADWDFSFAMGQEFSDAVDETTEE